MDCEILVSSGCVHKSSVPVANSTTVPAELNRRTFHIPIRAEHAAITLKRSQQRTAGSAFVIELTSIGRHHLPGFVTALRTGQCRIRLEFCGPFHVQVSQFANGGYQSVAVTIAQTWRPSTSGQKWPFLLIRRNERCRRGRQGFLSHNQPGFRPRPNQAPELPIALLPHGTTIRDGVTTNRRTNV